MVSEILISGDENPMRRILELSFDGWYDYIYVRILAASRTDRGNKMFKKVYYGWAICILCTFTAFVTMGGVTNGFSIFLPYIIEEYGFTFSQSSSLITIRCLVSLGAMFCIGVFYDHVSIRIGLALAVASTGLSYCIYGLADQYVMFGIGAAISGISYGFGSMIPITILISRWFIKHRALALGICASGSSMASIVLSPLTTILIENHSLGQVFLMEGMLWFVIAALVAIFLRNKPSEMRLRPYGQKELHDRIREEGIKGKVVSFGLSKRGWVLTGCVSLSMGALANPGFSHLPVLFSTEGFAPMVVAAIISGIGITITISKVLFGEMVDKIGGHKSSILAFSILIVGHILCCFAFLQSVPLCAVTVIVLGFGYPIATIGPSIWAADMVSQDRFPDVVRRFQIIYACGALAFSNIPGIIADHMGGYIPAYGLFTVMIVISLVCIALAYRENRKNTQYQKT